MKEAQAAPLQSRNADAHKASSTLPELHTGSPKKSNIDLGSLGNSQVMRNKHCGTAKTVMEMGSGYIPNNAYNDDKASIGGAPFLGTIKNLFDSKKASMDVAVGHSRTTKAQHQIEQISLAKSLNEEIRSQFLENRKQKYTSQVMQPPHLTVSVNAGREQKKDEILRMAQKANHLTESLVN